MDYDPAGERRVRRPARILFVFAATILWLAAAALALELYAAKRLRAIEHADATLPLHPGWNPRPPVFDEPAAPLEIPETSEEEECHLGTLFAGLSEKDRATYARLREELVLICSRAGNPLHVYVEPERAMGFGLQRSDIASKCLTELFPSTQDDTAAVLERVIASGIPASYESSLETPGGSLVVEVTCFPMPDATAVCSFRDVTRLPMTQRLALGHGREQDPLWKTPWFEYRANAVLSQAWYSNNVGFRDGYLALPKPPGAIRIVCVGGSTTLEGTSNDTTYPNVLERKLRQHFGSDAIDVVNCGVGGMGSLGERKRTFDYLRLEPDLIIHYNFVNDACHVLFPQWEREARPWRKLLRESRFINLYCNRLLVPTRNEMLTQLEHTTLANLRLMSEAVRSKGVDMAIASFACPDWHTLSREEKDFFESHLKKHWQGRYVTFPTYSRLVGLYNEQVRALCEQAGLRYIPLAEGLQGGANYFTDICHMSSAGIERKATVMFEHIEEYVASRLTS